MAMDIALTAGMRNNLLSLQNTSTLQAQTQGRLATGKKVNSALDNPTNFFAAQSATSRAADLTNRKDGMSEAVQMVQAANAGITGITALIQSAQGVASAALATTSSTDRVAYGKTFDTLMTQVTQLSSDSGYRGTNLLTAAKQTVEFAPATNGATLQIVGFNATAAGLTIANVSAGGTGGSGTLSWGTLTGVASTATETTNIQSSSTQLEGALNQLRSQSTSLSANLSVVTTRQDFTDNMVNTLQTGADNLTLADMNKEGANMLMLQTRQSLGTTSLSMASQAAQSVLKLF
jgi:flagellin